MTKESDVDVPDTENGDLLRIFERVEDA